MSDRTNPDGTHNWTNEHDWGSPEQRAERLASYVAFRDSMPTTDPVIRMNHERMLRPGDLDAAPAPGRAAEISRAEPNGQGV